MITRMLIPGAGNDDPGAVDFAVATRRLQGESHFCPGRKTGHTAKLDAILMNDDRVRC